MKSSEAKPTTPEAITANRFRKALEELVRAARAGEVAGGKAFMLCPEELQAAELLLGNGGSQSD